MSERKSFKNWSISERRRIPPRCRLYFPDKKEIQSVFDGKNAAALAIVAREKERAKLKGVAYEADVDGVLTVFGVNEDTIFEALGNDGWKESRFDRLLTRELPE